MGFNVSYKYQVIDNYTKPLKNINEQTEIFKRIINDLNKSGGLKALNRNLSKTADYADKADRPMRAINSRFRQAKVAAKEFNDQLSRSRSNLRAMNQSARALKLNMPTRLGAGRFGGVQGQQSGGGITSRLAPAALAVGVGMAASKISSAGADFEYTLASVSAKLGGLGDDEKRRLQAKAFQEASTSKFTTSQVASSMELMAMSGFKVEEIMGGLNGILGMSIATQTDVSEATSIAAGTLRAFGLQASEMNRVSDMFTKTSISANTNMVELGYAMKYIGPVAKSMGYEMETVLSSLAVLADENVRSETAGTSMRAILSRMSSNTQAQDMLKAIGVSVRDKDTGEMKSFPAIMKSISEGLAKIPTQYRDQAKVNIAGMEALSAFNILLGKTDKLVSKEDEIRSATGTTKKVREELENTTKGQRESMVSSFDVLITNMGLLGNQIFNVQGKFKAMASGLDRLNSFFIKGEGETKSKAQEATETALQGVGKIPAFYVIGKAMDYLAPEEKTPEKMKDVKPLAKTPITSELDLLKMQGSSLIDLRSGAKNSALDVNINVAGQAEVTTESAGDFIGNLGVSSVGG